MVTKTITNRDWQVLYSGLENLGGLDCSTDLSIKIARNMRIIKNELLEDMESAMKPTKEYLKYNTDLVKLAEKHAVKDEKGRPMKKDQNNYVMTDQAKFDAEKEILKNSKEHKEAVELREKRIEEFENVLPKETSLGLVEINKSELPEKMKPGQIEGIFDVLKFDTSKPIKKK